MLEQELKKEIETWTKRIHAKRQTILLHDQLQEYLIRNIDAYIKDSQYFREKNDLIKSFEALIWAWSWLEILEELGVIASKTEQNA